MVADSQSARGMLTLGVGVAAGLSVGAFLWHRRQPSGGRILLLKALEGEMIRIPADARKAMAEKVIRAFYGHPNHLWNKTKGRDVTGKVKGILSQGGSLRADNGIYGDPVPGFTKMLAVEVMDDGSNFESREEDTEADRTHSAPSSAPAARDTNKIPQRPVHYVVRPKSDPRLDQAMYVRYDPAPDHKSGAIIIVTPGGNYDESGINGSEGQLVAQWLVENGITAIVLQYRCVSTGHYWPSQFEDWEDCARAVKRDAPSWGCDPERIGVLGFSAGGHLAAYAALKASPDIRPKLHVLVYPAIDTLSPIDGAMDPWQAIQGYPPVEASIHLLACPEAPPAFLAGISADRYTPAVENTDVYAAALKECGVAYQYVRNEDEEEDHGCGLKDWWTVPCVDWLRTRGFAR